MQRREIRPRRLTGPQASLVTRGRSAGATPQGAANRRTPTYGHMDAARAAMLALGLNSGSSFDGVDAVLVEIDLGDDGMLQRPRFLAGKTVRWPDDVAEQVLAAFENKLTIFELCRLNYVAGALYAETARSLMRETGVAPEAARRHRLRRPDDLPGAGRSRRACRRLPARRTWSANGSAAPTLAGLQIAEPADRRRRLRRDGRHAVPPGRPRLRRLRRAAHAVPRLRRVPRHRADPDAQHRRHRQSPARRQGPAADDGVRHRPRQRHARPRRAGSARQAL